MFFFVHSGTGVHTLHNRYTLGGHTVHLFGMGHSGLHQKRHNSNSAEYYDSSIIKRRTGDGVSDNIDLSVAELSNEAAGQYQFLDTSILTNSPAKARHEKTPSITKPHTMIQMEHTPQPRALDGSAGDMHLPQSPFYLPTTSQINLEAAATVNENSSIRRSDSVCRLTTVDNNVKIAKLQNNSHASVGITTAPATAPATATATPIPAGTATEAVVATCSHIPINDNDNVNFPPSDTNMDVPRDSDPNQGPGKGSCIGNAGDGSAGNNTNNTSNNNNNNNSNNNNNDDGNGDNNGAGSSAAVDNKSGSQQQLVEKLQEIYKSIVKQETELQERCSKLTTQQTTDLKNLWLAYKVNADLIDNYILFITTALLPSQSKASLAIGQEIVDVYRIERRLWVYGTITFLDVLKNFSNFMDPEICCQFIAYVFIALSNMLEDLPPKYSIPWLERLGDLSRMAIALYPSGFVDWKLSAEHWYRESLKYTFGHGKLYYHMSTVQQNTLEAFVNLGKSVFCEDIFVPSPQYMQLVIDNIYQRAFAERDSTGHRSNHIVDYLKHTEVMLLPSFLESSELQNVVIHYFQHKFGVSSSGNFFDPNLIFIQDAERLKHVFRHSALFSQSHILQLCGFGDPKNPFAILFELPKYLKSRKERKGRKKNTRSTSEPSMEPEFPSSEQTHVMIDDFFDSIDSPKVPYEFPLDIVIWKKSLHYINVTSMKCGMIVLRRFLCGPIVTALPHLLPWLLFLISLQIKLDQIGDITLKKFWIVFVRRIFPWDSLITFMNTLVHYCQVTGTKNFDMDSYMSTYLPMNREELLKTFCENENLPECWSCWGSLWFDVICKKSDLEFTTLESTGLSDTLFLDAPTDGICFDDADETGSKYWQRICRTLLLFNVIVDWQGIGGFGQGCMKIVKEVNDWRDLNFRFDDDVNDALSVELYPKENESFPFEKFEIISDVNRAESGEESAKSMIPGVRIEELQGFTQMHPDYFCFNKNGDLITGSLYTKGPLETANIYGGDDFNANRVLDNGKLIVQERLEYSSVIDKLEQPWLEAFMNPEFRQRELLHRSFLGNLNCQADTNVTFFVLDATTWLRHFAHIYKLATSNVLKFAICLTTFQELRFLRKSKDESVLEAATRAVIAVRQLYYERNLLALRFTGNVAGHLEEHLEIEEQMTWKSHVDEFVIDAIAKAQEKFNVLNNDAMQNGKDCIPVSSDTQDPKKFNFISLVTDDFNMRNKAQQLGIRTFSTRFVFAVCRELGREAGVCTN